MKKISLIKLVETGVLAGIILLMASFPMIGYIHIGPLAITLLTIPVVIGAISVGPLSGLFLGTVFGMTSYLTCFGMFGGDAFGAALVDINPLFAFILCVPTRMLMGLFTGLIFKALYKTDKTKTVSYFVSGLLGALLNTILFMGVLILLFWNTDYIQGIASSAGATSILLFIWAMVGVNGIVEMCVTCAVGGAVSKALSRIIRHSSEGDYV